MPTYSDWLNSTRTLYANAITNAYNNRNTSGNDWYKAWQTMSATSDLSGILPPSSTAFWNTGGPNATEANILTLQSWLQNNPVTAGQLSLEPTLAHRDDGRSALGNAGNVGSEKRRWKGQPLYTFANGVLIGKNNQIAAAIGTEGGADLDGFGTDTISYFDGIPFATGTGTPGTTVFRGDTVVSGSIKGTGGVVIIPDVIQLEQDSSITNPAGIGVDEDGKIRLRHRGEGFKDLVAEIATAETDATNAAKVWTATQNTSSGRWGNSLIANSNFSFKTVHPTTYAESFSNIISVGTTSNILSSPGTGIARFTGNAGGICFQAIPINSDRYAVRIRFKGSATETGDNNSAAEGLFLAFHETTDEDLGNNDYVYDNTNPGSNYEGSSTHTSNVTQVFPTSSTTTDSGGNIDGITVATSYVVHSFTYSPSSNAKNASLVIYAKNYSGTIDLDYVVLTEAPRTQTEINSLITSATDDITAETEESLVPDAQGTDKTKWAARGTGTTIDNDTDRLTSGGDPAIKLSTPTAGGSLVSSRVACESDRYIVGAKVRVLSAVGGNPTISMFAIEDPTQSYPTIGAALTTPLTHPSGTNAINNISIVEVNSSGVASGAATAGVTVPVDTNFHMLIGTYETTVTYIDSDDNTYTTYDATRTPHPTTPIQLPGSFSIAVKADRECVVLVDYVYARVQGASVNIAEGLANQAYTDSHGFVTAMNQLVIKESGSIITNSSMAILDTNNKPSGWRTTTDCTLTFDNTGDYAIQITRTGSGTRRLVTPTFSLGTADKFSIGVRIKGVSGGITPVVKVAVSSDSLVPTNFVTIAQTNGGKSDVYTTNTTETSALTIAPTTTTGTNYATVLATWNRSSSQQNFVGGMASLVIESAGDFIVDYVFVKEQTVSYNLADAQAESRRDEAIAQSEGYLTGLSETMAQESGSLMSNAGFGSWYLTNGTTGNQRPQGWYTTRNNSSSPLRVIAASEGANSTGETVENVNQTGSALKFSPGAAGGMLSPKFDLPISPAFGSEIDSSQEASGKYTLAVRVRLGSAEPVGIRLYAHEYYKFTDTIQTHVLCTDHAYGTSTYESTTKIKAFTTSVANGAVSRIKLINFTTADTVVGYGSDEYIEYLPVDNSETQGDTDGTASNYETWYQIGGTYSPNASTKQVSFEVVIEGDPDSDSSYPNVYIDYVNLVAQPFDADFAQSLADSRITTNVGTFSGSGGYSGMNIAQALNLSITSLQQVESDLADEIASSSIIPDSFFQDNTSGESNTWMPTRSTSGTVDVSNTGSHGQTGTYAKLPAGTDHTVGMLSKYIPRADLFATGTNTFFNVVVRLRDQTDSSGEEYSVIVIAHEWFSSTAPSNNWVYANGGSFALSSQSSTVSRYNTGSDGQTQTLNGIGATLIGSGNADGEVELAQGDASWKTVAFEYQANTNTKYVSFEIVINEDYDNDGDADVLIDGVLLQQATDQTLVNTLADTQILATDFTSGGTLYAQNSGFASTIDDLSTATGDIQNIETNLGTVATSIGDLVAAANETALVNEQIASEVATLIGNGGFSDGLTDKKHIPLGFIPHQYTYNFVRYLSSSDTTISKTDAYNPSNGGQTSTTYNWDLASVINGHGASTTGYTEITNAPYYNASGNGFGVAFGVKEDTTIWDTQDGMAGFYTKALSLPNLETQNYTVTTTHSDTATSATTTEGARYTVAFRVQPLKQAQEFAIVAHEYDTDLSPSTSGGYIKAATGTNPTTPASASYTANMTYAFGEKHGGYLAALGMTAYTATRNIILDVLELSDSGDSSRDSFESVTANTWATVGGTYTATGTAKCVSFSLLVRTNPNSTTLSNWTSSLSGLNTNYSSHSATDDAFITTLCDFAYMEPQLMNADMVENIAALRAADVQNTLDDSLTTLEDNLGAESDSLMPNGNFAQKFTASSVDYVKNWLPTGNGSADKLQLYAADSASKSIGTYVKFNKNASGGSAPYGTNKSGIISKAILNPVEIVRDLDGNINAFNIGMRIRGTTDEVISYVAGTNTGGYKVATAYGGSSLSTDLYNGMSSTGGGAVAFDIGSVSISNTNSSYIVDTAIQNNSYGHRDGFIAANNQGIEISTTSFNGKSSVLYMFGLTSLSSDTNRNVIALPRKSNSNITSGYSTSWWYSTNKGASWTKASTEDTSYPYFLALNNNLYSNGGFETDYLFAVLFQVDASSDTATFGSSFADTVRFYMNGATGNTAFSKGLVERSWNANATTATIPDFTVKLIAHETYEAVADPNVIIRGPLVNMDSTSIPTGVGVTVPAAFSSGPPATGVSTAQNLIDLRYSGSSASTEITIDASAVNDDAGEAITDWRHIVGSYTPNEATTAVSFEVLIDHEPDESSPVQEVWLDSITMAVSSVGTDLAQTIADNRVFVEQNFQGGSTPVSPNNVIINADMSKVFLDGTTKRPQNWAYWSTGTISGGYDNIFVSPDSTTTNRAITFKKGTTNSHYYGITSKPFRITSQKYKIRIVYNVATGSSTASGNNKLHVAAITYDSELSDAADSIKLSDMNLHPSSTAYITAAGVNTSYTTQVISNVQRSFSATKVTVELTWTPITVTSSTRPNGSALPRYASLRVGVHDSTSAYDINIWEISAVPEGGQYPSYQLGSGETKAYGTDFDDDGDVLPDAPRETESKDPLYQSIDIQVSDTTQSSPPKDRLLMALPRKHFPNNTSTDPNGTSYLYPGVSDLEYTMQDTTLSLLGILNLGPVGDSRSITFPSSTNNSIKNVSMITFQKDENPSGNIDQGWYNPAWNGGSKATGAQIIEQLGGLWFDEKYEPGGWAGDEVSSGGKQHGPKVYGGTRPTSYKDNETYVNSVGSHIANVKSIYVGTNWNYNSSNAMAPPFWDAYISSTSSSANLNGYGTTLGNTTDYGTGDKSENPNLAKYNRMGGIYVKQTHHAHGVHCIKYNGTSRWALGMGRYGSTDTESFYFHYSTDESTSPISQGYILYNRHSSEGAGTSMNFTGQHRCEDKNDSLQNADIGLIVVSTGQYNNLLKNQKPTINESLPVVALSTKRNQKSVFGVLSNKEDRNGGPREYNFGNFVSVHHDTEQLDRLIINSLGEGAVWICNINGNLENGDYITTCEIPGYGMLQDDDLLHNYTVAKITQDCNFELDNPLYDCVEFEHEGNTYRKAFVGCTYHCG